MLAISLCYCIIPCFDELHQTCGELFDLGKDSKELINLWDYSDLQNLKIELFLKLLHADQAKEPLFMPRIAIA